MRRTSYAGEMTPELKGKKNEAIYTDIPIKMTLSSSANSVLQDRLPKSATSEPKLYRKMTVLTRGRVVRAGTRQASRSSVNTDPDGNESKPCSSPAAAAGEAAAKDSGGDTSEPSLAASEATQDARPKLQRQKAQSRKTFKFRKTRKEVRKLSLFNLAQLSFSYYI